jgi:peptidoglycan/xylan/chitin deacetylase (PgdA/CDA1 family)
MAPVVSIIRQFVSIVAKSAAFEKFVGLLEHAGEEGTDLLRVLTYHRVDELDAHPYLHPGLISASPESFALQMKYLAANYEPLSVKDVSDALENAGRNRLPRRAVLVTFDDAYCDFGEHAWPVLKQYHIPALLFVPTAFPDHPDRLFWWDRLFHALHTTSVGELASPVGHLSLSTEAQRDQAYKLNKTYLMTVHHNKVLEEVDRMCAELGVIPMQNMILSWNSLRQLAREGLVLGGHTQNHPIMNCITQEEMEQEVKGSLDDLQRETGIRPSTFAYPSGLYSNEAVNMVRRAGINLAFTTERGINLISRADPLRLKRINVGGRTTLPILRAQLLSRSVPLYSLGNRLFG